MSLNASRTRGSTLLTPRGWHDDCDQSRWQPITCGTRLRPTSSIRCRSEGTRSKSSDPPTCSLAARHQWCSLTARPETTRHSRSRTRRLTSQVRKCCLSYLMHNESRECGTNTGVLAVWQSSIRTWKQHLRDRDRILAPVNRSALQCACVSINDTRCINSPLPHSLLHRTRQNPRLLQRRPLRCQPAPHPQPLPSLQQAPRRQRLPYTAATTTMQQHQ